MGTPPPIQLGTLSMPDTLILMALALVVFGPRRLPQIGRQLGKLMFEFRKASNDFKFQMEEEFRVAEDSDRRKKEEAERTLAAGATAQPALETATTTVEPTASEMVPSPYPGETVYPEMSSAPTPVVEAVAPIAEAAAPAVEAAEQKPEQTAAEEKISPAVTPTASGETVAATPHAPAAEQSSAPAQSAEAQIHSTEQEAHHG